MADDEQREDERAVYTTLLGYLWEDHRYQRIETTIHLQVGFVRYGCLKDVILML